MPNWLPQSRLRKKISQALQEISPPRAFLPTKEEIELKHPANPDHGDLATNIALILAKKWRQKPLEIAQLLAEKLPQATVAPPGFINFRLSQSELWQQAKIVGNQEELKKKLAVVGQGKTLVIDYSSPNIAKPFGIGHLRSTNIGQAIYNLYHFLGWKTIGDNHLGDWGTQFGKLIYMIKSEGLQYSDLTISKLERLYVEFHRRAEEKPQLEEEARKWFKKLEQKDPEAKKIWQWCVKISLQEFERVYQLLGVKIDYAYGESFYQDKMEAVLADARKKGILQKSRGAWVIKIPHLKVPAMLVKSDGATTYLLRDLAAIKFRVKKWQPDLIVYEVGADQKLHFRQIFAVAEMLGYIASEKLVHVAHGMIRWASGKFSTRRGRTIHLEEVIKEGIKRAEKLVEASQTSRDLSQKEKRKIAQAVGIGGIKFNDLKQEPEKDIVFDWEKVLTLEGYSAPYLQYTYARCASVLRKANYSVANLVLPSPKGKLSKEEETLLRFFYQFPETILAAAEGFAPHLLAQYLFALAQKFNLLYQKQRILTSPRRLFLTAVTAQVLKMGLEILGIEVLEKM